MIDWAITSLTRYTKYKATQSIGYGLVIQYGTGRYAPKQRLAKYFTYKRHAMSNFITLPFLLDALSELTVSHNINLDGESAEKILFSALQLDSLDILVLGMKIEEYSGIDIDIEDLPIDLSLLEIINYINELKN